MTKVLTPNPLNEVDRPPISRGLIFILALACGVVVANMYFVQPLVGLISHDLGMPIASAGLLVTLTQAGYAVGLLLVVPLADIVENRRLILGMLSVLSFALICESLAPTVPMFLAASLLVGISASMVQVIVPFAGHLAPDASRGRVVGTVTGGLFFGIMLSRPAASFVAHFAGHRTIFKLSAVAIALLVVLLFRTLPERRPKGMTYFRALGSLGPLLIETKVLHYRGAYQAGLFAAFSLFWTTVPLLLASPTFGFTQIGIGVFALIGAAGAIVSPYAGHAADHGKSSLITALGLFGTIGALILAALGGLWASLPLLAIAALVIDMAVAANLVVGQRALFALGAELRGRLNGLYLASFFIAGAIGSLASGYAYASGGWTAVCLTGLVFPALAVAYYASEPRQMRP